MRGLSRRLCVVAVPLATLLLPAGASADRRHHLTMASARRAITTYERNYWEGHGVWVRIVRCNRNNGVEVTCKAEAVSAEGMQISTTDSATLLPQDIIRVHPGRVEEVLVLQG